MAIVIKPDAMKYRDANGDYKGVDIVAETATATQVAAVAAEGATQIQEIQNKADAAMSLIPSETTLTDLSNDFAAQYSSSSAYAVGAYCMHEYKLYRCNTAIASGGEAWTAAHWTLVNTTNELTNVKNTLTDEVDNLKSALTELEIKDYDKALVVVDGTLVKRKLMNTDGTTIDTAAFNYLVCEVTAGEHYLVTATGNPAIVAFASDDSVISTYQPGVYVNINDYDYTAPSGVSYIAVNRSASYNLPVVKEKYHTLYSPKTALKNALTDASKLKDMSIEGYTEDLDVLSGTVHAYSIAVTTGGYSTGHSGWTSIEYDVTAGEKYKVTATGNPAYVLVDSNDDVIGGYNPGTYVNITDYEIEIPRNCVKIRVNRFTYSPILTYTNRFVFIHDNIGVEKESNVWEVGKDYVYTLTLENTNGVVNYTELKKNGTSFKPCADDVAPVLGIGIGYIGANHGFNFGYKCKATAHGLVNADIGKSYNDGTNTWTLARIDDVDYFTIFCRNSGAWYGVKTATVPQTVDFGAEITVESNALIQFKPCAKNISHSVIENNDKSFKISEVYDIYNIGDGLDKIEANVGDNTNDSIVEFADSIYRIRTIYEFNKYGSVTLYQEIENFGYGLDAYYGTQVMAWATTDLVTAIGSVAETLQSEYKSFSKSNWLDQNKAPAVFIKSDSTKAKGMMVAYLIDRTTDISTYAGTMYANTGKLYPDMVNPYNSNAKAYKNITLRIPFTKNDSGADYVGYANVGNDVYVFIGLLSAKSVTVQIPTDIFGRTLTVADKTASMTIETGSVVTGIKVTSSGEGYALVKLS